MKFQKFCLLSTGITLSAASIAADTSCVDSYRSAQDVLRCAQLNHPYIVRERSRLKQGDKLMDIASALPNPEMDARVEHQDNSGQDSISTDITILQTLELGGKRGSRQLRAEAEKMSLASTAVSVQEEISVQAVVDLYRLRQLYDERLQIQEAIGTFEKVSRQYRQRERLNAEQAISSSILKMAISDYGVRRGLVEAEIQERTRSIEFATGRKFEINTKLLPAAKKTWPNVSESGDGKEGSEVLKAKAELAVAGAEIELANSEAWPDLKIGPAFSNSGQGANSQQTLGVMVSIPLPIFNQNVGKREYSRLGVEMSARNFEAVQSRVAKDRANLVNRYRNAVDSLKKAANLDPIQEHAKVEGYMERGIVPSSLAIESHRQLIDFLKNRHEQEISAIEALWKIYAIDGDIEKGEI